ncbi:fatty acyl-AMP ligase [[Mycobacterium] vasticus]|uniref:Fatty acyl-AMP ligase n=1 Tax=[Mycobacterium] vasticus TaxID=2875777 RepID=A0ABU5YZF2_9MYCO|nr:fatty acyl-AMP ligase [Mycolicibacter sp. MYC017]MEB3070522.1 fatty acyl-AMP ligase [Mycolicibacter sp. MYC017]
MGVDIVPTADTLVELLRQQAARLGEKTAFNFSRYGDGRDGEQVTYRELDARARAIGAALQGLGAAGQRVLVFCSPGLHGIAGIFGCWYAGAVAVPVPERLGSRLAVVIADVGPGFAVASPQMPQSIRSAVDTLAGRAGAQPLVWCGTDQGDADAWVAPGIDADSSALIVYSAGSRCYPLGVVLTHENVLTNLEAIGSAGLGGQRDVAVSWLPVHTERGLIGVVLAEIYLGATTVLMSPSAFVQRPMCWLEAISRWRGTMSTAPGFAYRMCVQRSTPAERAGVDVSSLSTAVINGAEPVPAATMRAFAEAFAAAGFRAEAFTPVYGLAEATLLVSGGAGPHGPVMRHVDRVGLHSGWALDTDPNDSDAVSVVGCGRPRQPVVVVDPDTRLECGPDEVGEIWVSGPGVARSYWNAPVASDQIFEAFLADSGGGPFLRTGDRGFLRAGELFVTGRCPGLVVLGGVHYHPNELEATVQDCHAVLLAGRGAVFADESEQLVVVNEVSCDIGEAELAPLVSRIQSALRESHGIEAHSIVLVGAMRLPTTEAGAIRRSVCRWQYLEGDLDALAQWHAPSSADTAGEAREANVVEFREGVMARRQRVCQS